VSGRVRADLLARGIGTPERFLVVPVGLDLERLASPGCTPGGLRRELGVGPAMPLVGIVARLVPIKAHEVFLEAARRLSDRFEDIRFVVVGDGERRGELERMRDAMGLARRVVFLGWRSDLDGIYTDLDVVALTSRNEGSPVALIEAMAAGRAVVSTDVGGVADVVQDGATGCLVASGDAGALASTIERLCRDAGERGRLGDAARRHVLERYGAHRLVADIDALYTGLLVTKGIATV
jgi:glycosyltransferase involved in cell wall biosynthesis